VADAQSPGGYRPPPPDTADLIAWPADFGTRYAIFVDTEEEFDWNAPLSREGHGTSAIAALPDAHRRFAERGIPITYLVDYPVVSDARAVDVLRGIVGDGRSAIGTQLHAWVNPPFVEDLTPANSFAGNLPENVEAAKLDALTAAITAAFGRAPRAFRAGRYGIGPATLRLLAEQGYALDSSMRARYDYSAEGGPDFSGVGNATYRVGPMVELPLTTIFTGALRASGPSLYRTLGKVPRARGAFARLGLLSRIALTPEDMPVADAVEAIAVAAGEGVRVLNFSFHSPSVAPGMTPYVRDAPDLAAFHAWWDAVIGELGRRGIAPVSSDEIIAAATLPPSSPIR
jgi:hypothetical protein